MSVSVIISLCDNRYEMFKRALDTWNNQTVKDFELVLVDDGKRDDILELCKQYKELKFQFIRIDNSKCDKPIQTFIPILSNNIGFRNALGEVVVVTGPETLQAEKNIEVSCTMKDRKLCAYGLVYKSNKAFVKTISENWPQDFNSMLNIEGAKNNCLTKFPHPPAYWYYMAVAKKYVEAIGGVDEDFACGICAEDDDFSNRMRMSGVTPVFEHKIMGIHQDHSIGDADDPKHNFRYSHEGVALRQKNIFLMQQNLSNKKVIANTDHVWGDNKVIIFKEFFGDY